jgi:hypothetical protein
VEFIMVSSPQTKYSRRKHHRYHPSVPSGPVPSSGPHVVSVSHSAIETQLIVTLSEPLDFINENVSALSVYLPGVYWLQAHETDKPDPLTVLFNFDESVATATEWVVPGPDVWVFVSGEMLELPFGGTIG